MAATLPVCVVAGVGEKGIGEHVSSKFSAEGYQIAMLARREENLRSIEKEIPNSKAYVCDVSNTALVMETMAKIESELGPVEVLLPYPAPFALRILHDRHRNVTGPDRQYLRGSLQAFCRHDTRGFGNSVILPRKSIILTLRCGSS